MGINPAAAQIEVVDVSKSYDGHTQVVQNLSLTVQRGEFLTLLGPSGSGKTTCLMMLAGFETPSSGEIRIGGRSVHDLPPRQRDIGVVFQNYALFPHMSVGENLSFPLEVRGLDPAERAQRVAKALRTVRLEGFERRRPAELSGGQQQRVAIARALVFEPGLVLMDEPLGALDRRLRESMQYEIRRIQRDLGVTMVYVTHDQQEAMVLSDRVAVFHRGEVEQVASPETLYEEPEREFVARFIGDNNLLRGPIESIEGDSCRVDIAGQSIKAFLVEPSTPGTPVVLAVRPERVALWPGPVYVNQVDAVIEDIVFLGDHLQLRLTVAGAADFFAKIPNRVGQGAVLTGDRVRVGWSATDCRALADERQSPLEDLAQ